MVYIDLRKSRKLEHVVWQTGPKMVIGGTRQKCKVVHFRKFNMAGW